MKLLERVPEEKENQLHNSYSGPQNSVKYAIIRLDGPVNISEHLSGKTSYSRTTTSTCNVMKMWNKLLSKLSYFKKKYVNANMKSMKNPFKSSQKHQDEVSHH